MDAGTRSRPRGPLRSFARVTDQADSERRQTLPAFLICVEHGRLESEAILLVESLRTWGGSCAEAPVYAFAPRPEFQPGPQTVERLDGLGATFIDEPLVDRFAETPTFNKVAVAAWAERELDHETLVFTDTDCVFARRAARSWPTATGLRRCARSTAGSPARAARARASPTGRRCTTRSGSRAARSCAPRSARWRSAPTGTAAWSRPAAAPGLFGAWEHALDALFDAGVVAERWPHFMDQLSLAAVTADHHDRVRILSEPTTTRSATARRSPPRGRAGPRRIVHLHYRLWFHMPRLAAEGDPAVRTRSDRYQWLDERLPIEPTEDGE